MVSVINIIHNPKLFIYLNVLNSEQFILLKDFVVTTSKKSLF